MGILNFKTQALNFSGPREVDAAGAVGDFAAGAQRAHHDGLSTVNLYPKPETLSSPGNLILWLFQGFCKNSWAFVFRVYMSV